MNKSFNSTTLRLSPAKALIELQHQANHIKNIIHPRKISSHQNSREQQKTYSSHLESKFEKQRRQSIHRQNERILKDCVYIYKAKGILQKAEEDSKIAQKHSKKTLISEYKAKEKMDELKKQNRHFKQKIQKLKPLVGDKDQWKKHEKFTCEMIGKLRNTARNKMYNNETIMRIALSSEKEKTNYLHLFKTLNFEKRESEAKQENVKPAVKTAREKRKRRRTLKKNILSQTLNAQDHNSLEEKDQSIQVEEHGQVQEKNQNISPLNEETLSPEIEAYPSLQKEANPCLQKEANPSVQKEANPSVQKEARLSSQNVALQQAN